MPVSDTASRPVAARVWAAMDADCMFVPCPGDMAAMVGERGALYPVAPSTVWGLWHIDSEGRPELCEFDGCVAYIASLSRAAMEAEARRTNAQYPNSRYVVLPIPAGIACNIDNRDMQAGGEAAEWEAYMDGGFVCVRLISEPVPVGTPTTGDAPVTQPTTTRPAFAVSVIIREANAVHGSITVARTGKAYWFAYRPEFEYDGLALVNLYQASNLPRRVPLSQLRDVRHAVRQHFAPVEATALSQGNEAVEAPDMMRPVEAMPAPGQFFRRIDPVSRKPEDQVYPVTGYGKNRNGIVCVYGETADERVSSNAAFVVWCDANGAPVEATKAAPSVEASAGPAPVEVSGTVRPIIRMQSEGCGMILRAFLGDRCLATATHRRRGASGPRWTLTRSNGAGAGTSDAEFVWPILKRAALAYLAESGSVAVEAVEGNPAPVEAVPVLSSGASAVYVALVTHHEGVREDDADGAEWAQIYLDNARPSGMSARSFAGFLSALESAGLYRSQGDDFFGMVKLPKVQPQAPEMIPQPSQQPQARDARALVETVTTVRPAIVWTRRLRKLARTVTKKGNMHKRDPLADRAARAERFKRIAATTRNGMIPLDIGSKDCDGYTSRWRRSIPPFVMAYELVLHRLHDGAEGPVWVYIPERYLARAGLLDSY